MGTQISLRLPDQLFRHIDQEARRRRMRRSDLVRQALEAFLKGQTVNVADRPYDRVRDLIGRVSGGPPDLGERHREYLRAVIRDRR